MVTALESGSCSFLTQTVGGSWVEGAREDLPTHGEGPGFSHPYNGISSYYYFDAVARDDTRAAHHQEGQVPLLSLNSVVWLADLSVL